MSVASDLVIMYASLTKPWGVRHSRYTVLAVARAYPTSATACAPWVQLAGQDRARFSRFVAAGADALAAQYRLPPLRLGEAAALRRAAFAIARYEAAIAQTDADISTVMDGG